MSLLATPWGPLQVAASLMQSAAGATSWTARCFCHLLAHPLLLVAAELQPRCKQAPLADNIEQSTCPPAGELCGQIFQPRVLLPLIRQQAQNVLGLQL